jgi:hypothetical protein
VPKLLPCRRAHLTTRQDLSLPRVIPGRCEWLSFFQHPEKKLDLTPEIGCADVTEVHSSQPGVRASECVTGIAHDHGGVQAGAAQAGAAQAGALKSAMRMR